MANAQGLPNKEQIIIHLARICASPGFQGAPKRQRLLRILIDEYLQNGGANLKGEFIGPLMGEEPVFEPDRFKEGFPQTRSNLQHLRIRLTAYLETTGYNDLIVFKLNKGSYIPAVAYNPRGSHFLPVLDPHNERLILRAKTAIDRGTLIGALHALTYFEQLDTSSDNPRLISNLAFIPFAIAPIIPYAARAFESVAEGIISAARATGFEPWECTFADGCISACRHHDWPRALSLFEAANSTSQGEAKFLWWYPALLASQGHIGQSIEILDSAVRHFSRTNVAARCDLALLLVMSGRFVEAEEMLSATLDLTDEANPLIACLFGILFEAQDRLSDAGEHLWKWFAKAMNQFENGSPLSMETAKSVDANSFITGMFVLVSGRLNFAAGQRFFDGILRRKERTGKTSSVELAIALIGLGRHDEAVAWLHKAAFEEADPFAMWLNIFPPLRHLRRHPGFSDLLSKLNLPPGSP